MFVLTRSKNRNKGIYYYFLCALIGINLNYIDCVSNLDEESVAVVDDGQAVSWEAQVESPLLGEREFEHLSARPVVGLGQLLSVQIDTVAVNKHRARHEVDDLVVVQIDHHLLYNQKSHRHSKFLAVI